MVVGWHDGCCSITHGDCPQSRDTIKRNQWKSTSCDARKSPEKLRPSSCPNILFVDTAPDDLETVKHESTRIRTLLSDRNACHPAGPDAWLAEVVKQSQGRVIRRPSVILSPHAGPALVRLDSPGWRPMRPLSPRRSIRASSCRPGSPLTLGRVRQFAASSNTTRTRDGFAPETPGKPRPRI